MVIAETPFDDITPKARGCCDVIMRVFNEASIPVRMEEDINALKLFVPNPQGTGEVSLRIGTFTVSDLSGKLLSIEEQVQGLQCDMTLKNTPVSTSGNAGVHFDKTAEKAQLLIKKYKEMQQEYIGVQANALSRGEKITCGNEKIPAGQQIYTTGQRKINPNLLFTG